MKKLPVLFVFIFFLNQFGIGQTKTDYASPLDIPLVLAANFGELRPNHFHMGVDFKTEGRIGFELHSVEKGYVSRVVISSFGYGKVVHIAHPNGVTSVYAHCSKLQGNLAKVILKKQQELKQNQVDLTFKPNEIPIKRREVFALSGNTGSSTAPHLHFELRDTKTDAGLNPLVYGFDIADSKPPEIRRLKIYSLTDRGYRYPRSRELTVRGGAGNYSCKDTVQIPSDFCSASGGIGFSFDVIDRLDGASNPCGMYESDLKINGKKVFGQQIKRVPFESTRFVNVHKDYEEFFNHKYKFHKAYKTRENDLPIYNTGDGILKVKPGDTLNVNYTAKDAKGNSSNIRFVLVVESGNIRELDAIVTDFTFLSPGYPMKVNKSNTVVEFGKSSVYEPLSINSKTISHSIGRANTPVHNPYKLKVKRPEHKLESKQYLHMITARGRGRKIFGEREGDWLTFDVKYFGDYTIRTDTTAPVIHPKGISSTSRSGRLRWGISDSQTGIGDYNLYVGDTWVKLDYEYKNHTLSTQIPNNLKGEHEVKLIVTDKRGNDQVWTKTMQLF